MRRNRYGYYDTMNYNGYSNVIDRRVHTYSDKIEEVLILEHKGKNIFFEYNFPISISQTGYFQPGQYSFPFSFVLPDNLPGSFRKIWTEYNHQSMAQIGYTLFAGFMAPNMSFFKSFDILVNQKINPNSIFSSHFQNKLKCYCCFNRGACDLKLDLEKNIFQIGDKLNFRLEVDNSKCKNHIKKFKVKLIQVSVFKADDGFQRRYENIITRKDLPGLKSGKKRIGKDAIESSLAISLLDEMQATSEGNFVTNLFELYIKADMKCMCCSSCPTNIVKIKIFHRSQDYQPQQPNIPNWNPQQMDTYLATLSNDFAPDQNMINHMDNAHYPSLEQ